MLSKKPYTFLLFLGMLLFVLTPGYAQDGGFRETFDDPSLPGWDAVNAVVQNGILRLEQGGLLGRGGEWGDFTLSARVRRIDQGDFAFMYRGSPTGTNIAVLGDSGVGVQREIEGVLENLDFAAVEVPANEWFEFGISVSGGQHRLTLNGEIILTVNEPNPLLPGGIALEVISSPAVEVDEMTLTLETPTPPADDAAPPAVSADTSQLAWVRTGGPPGGLGYDIRYNFDDPNIWYVTDNFAGVNISTDNGYTWQPSNNGIPKQLGPTADWRPIFSLTVDPHNPQIIWAGTDSTGHIYKSVDGGQTWEQKDNGVIVEYDLLAFRGFTVDPRSSDIVYAMGETNVVELGGQGIWSNGVGGVVYKTVDGGENWVKIWDGGMPSSLARYLWVDPRDPDVLYVSTGIFDRGAVGQGDPDTDIDPWGGLGVLKSTDGGETWTILGKDNGLKALYVGSLYMHPDNPDILLAAVGHETGFAQADYIAAQDARSGAGVYRTTDGGQTWTHVLVPPPERAGELFSAVEFCPSDPTVAYAGSEGAIYRSDDTGQTWTRVTTTEPWGTPGVRAGVPIDLQCDPRDPYRLFANNYQGGNFLSEDGGQTWQNASQGYTGAQTHWVSVETGNPAIVYAASRSGIWRSDDGGTTWYGLRNFADDHSGPAAEWGAIAADPARPATVFAADGDLPLILKSTDRGASWQAQLAPEGITGTVADYAFAPSAPDTIYAGFANINCAQKIGGCEDATGGIAVSRDGGQSWQIAPGDLLRDKAVVDLAVDPTNSQVIYAAVAYNGLYKTTDGGQSWTKLDLGDLITVFDPDLTYMIGYQAVAVNPSDPQQVFVGVGTQGIFMSPDGGATWQARIAGLEPNGSIADIVFDPTNPQTLYASDHLSGVYRSIDSGQTWIKINNALENRATVGMAISSDGQHLYVGTDGEGVYRLDLNSEPPSPAK
jgi:photosystem II stability/assembly factor-like uncharacterized protein